MAARRGYVPVLHAATGDRPDELDTVAAAEAVAAALLRLGYETDIVKIGLDLSALERLAARQPLAVFNLVEAVNGDDRLIALAPAVLEHFRLAFTGGGAASLWATGSKGRTKQLLRAEGLPTPDWSADGAGCAPGVRYIVKADMHHGSLGMDAGSVVDGCDAATEIRSRTARFGIGFLAERFVEGREFNLALVAAPGRARLLPLQEIVFQDFPDERPRIVDYEAKWDEDSLVYHKTVRRYGIEEREPLLAARLADIALKTWDALSLTGYARIDFRVDDGGRPFVLEVNVNPAIAPDAGFAAAAAEEGKSYDALIGLIVENAIPRDERAEDRIRAHA